MNRCAFLIIILAWFFLFKANANSQVEITTNTSETFTGFILDEDQETIKIRDINKTDHQFNKSGLKKITGVSVRIINTAGREFSGSVREYSDSAITIVSRGGILNTIPSAEIKSIEFSNEKGRDSYPLVGLSVFSPGGYNVVAGYQGAAGPLGIRLSAGTAFQGAFGGQVNLLYNLYKSRKLEHNLSAGFGFAREKVLINSELGEFSEINEGYFYGLYYDINFSGLFVEAGMARGNGRLKEVMFTIQLGFVYRFNK